MVTPEHAVVLQRRIAFSSEVYSGSREENASKLKRRRLLDRPKGHSLYAARSRPVAQKCPWRTTLAG